MLFLLFATEKYFPHIVELDKMGFELFLLSTREKKNEIPSKMTIRLLVKLT